MQIDYIEGAEMSRLSKSGQLKREEKMEGLIEKLEAALQEDPTQYNATFLRNALLLIAGLQAMYREALRQKGADGT